MRPSKSLPVTVYEERRNGAQRQLFVYQVRYDRDHRWVSTNGPCITIEWMGDGSGATRFLNPKQWPFWSELSKNGTGRFQILARLKELEVRQVQHLGLVKSGIKWCIEVAFLEDEEQPKVEEVEKLS